MSCGLECMLETNGLGEKQTKERKIMHVELGTFSNSSLLLLHGPEYSSTLKHKIPLESSPLSAGNFGAPLFVPLFQHLVECLKALHC